MAVCRNDAVLSGRIREHVKTLKTRQSVQKPIFYHETPLLRQREREQFKIPRVRLYRLILEEEKKRGVEEIKVPKRSMQAVQWMPKQKKLIWRLYPYQRNLYMSHNPTQKANLCLYKYHIPRGSTVPHKGLGNIFASQGIPFNDNTTIFKSDKFTAYYKTNGMGQLHSAPNHPGRNRLPERTNRSILFAKKRLLVSILNFVEKELQEDATKKATFNHMLKEIKAAYNINYQKEKAAKIEGENLVEIVENCTQLSEPDFNKQLVINSAMNFFTEECTKVDKVKSIKTIISDFEKLVKFTHLPREVENTAATINLLQIFSETQAAFYKTKGDEYFAKKEYKKAVQAFTMAINYTPTDETLFYDRAEANARLNNHGNVVKDSLEALRLNPAFAKSYGRLGWIFLGMHRYEDAVDSFQGAIYLDPTNHDYKVGLEIAQNRLRDQGGYCVIL
ncbi:hypothetical protein ILUMI_04633 [Ignelater luminosus]|uniref:Uncharacterized protein n=1 Tax=Ignelater luminosus TaxID=2038154 RepID=A0A8K0DJD2_IGNLU|nr:hypothetical protein ILUMI_04633 [Ignelater luminosus]